MFAGPDGSWHHLPEYDGRDDCCIGRFCRIALNGLEPYEMDCHMVIYSDIKIILSHYNFKA